MPDVKGFTEELKVEGKELVETVKRIIHEGNVRRVVVRNPEGRTILDIPVNAGVLGPRAISVAVMVLGSIVATA